MMPRLPSRAILLLACSACLASGCAKLIGIEPLPECGNDEQCARYGSGWVCNTTTHACEEPRWGMQCQNNDVCNVDAPICDPVMNTCRGCGNGTECSGKNQDTPICNMEGQCVDGCQVDADCLDQTAPICDRTSGMCKGCGGDDALCAARDTSTPYCAEDGGCVGCLNDGQCTAMATAPICDMESSSCRGCQEHGECASTVCNRDNGACVDAAAVIYVTKDGTGTDCTQEAPCGSIADALGKIVQDTRDIIRLDDGVYTGQLSLSNTKVRVLGDKATIQLDTTTPNIPVIDVGTSADVSLEGVIVKGANNGTSAHGIRCGGSGTSSVRVLGSSITGNAQVGISVTQCSLTVTRSAIIGNGGGGIEVLASAFDITNNYILDNGDVRSSAVAGVSLVNTAQVSPQRFAFNTVARNEAGPDSNAGGVHCDISASSMAIATSNIILEGFGGKPSISGDCVWRSSNIQGKDGLGSIAADGTNIDTDTCLLAPDADGLARISGGTPCDNAAAPVEGVTIDFDGDDRSAGTPDMGADELVP